MNIQIIGTEKCKNTRSAIRFFKERGIKYHLVDLRKRALSPGELDSIMRNHPGEALIDRESGEFRKRGLAYMVYDPREELLANPLLMKTPVVRNGREASLGIAQDQWEEWIRR